MIHKNAEGSELAPSAAENALAAENARVTSESLLGARGELVILHQGREYSLRLTRNGKLILTA